MHCLIWLPSQICFRPSAADVGQRADFAVDVQGQALMEHVALASAAAAVAWIGIVLNKFCITEATLWTWQQNLFEEGRVKQNAHGTWLYTFVGLEVPQDSIEKYLWLTRELYKKKELLRPQLTSQGTPYDLHAVSSRSYLNKFVDNVAVSLYITPNGVVFLFFLSFSTMLQQRQAVVHNLHERVHLSLVGFCKLGFFCIFIVCTHYVTCLHVRGQM